MMRLRLEAAESKAERAIWEGEKSRPTSVSNDRIMNSFAWIIITGFIQVAHIYADYLMRFGIFVRVS